MSDQLKDNYTEEEEHIESDIYLYLHLDNWNMSQYIKIKIKQFFQNIVLYQTKVQLFYKMQLKSRIIRKQLMIYLLRQKVQKAILNKILMIQRNVFDYLLISQKCLNEIKDEQVDQQQDEKSILFQINSKHFETYLCKVFKQLNEVAIQYLDIDMSEMSLVILNECYILTTQVYNGYAEMQILTYNNLSCYFRKCKDQKRALKFLQKAEAVYQKNQTTTNIGITYLNKSAILSELGRHQEAIKCAKGAVMELKNQFEKIYNKKNELQDRKYTMCNTKNDNIKLEEGSNMREEESRQLNQEFQDAATELGIAYHNLATEEQYFKLFEKSIKNFYNAYKIIQEYLGDDNPLTTQFYQSFEVMNKSRAKDISQQKKSPNKISESPEYRSKYLNQSSQNKTQTEQTMNSVENEDLNQSKEKFQSSNNFQQQKQVQTSQETKKDRKMFEKQFEESMIDYQHKMKATNIPVSLSYNDGENGKYDKNINQSQIPNSNERIDQYRQQYGQLPYVVKNQHNQQQNQRNQQLSTIKQNKQNNKQKVKAQKVSDLVENASQCSESPRDNENLQNLDQLMTRRNKSANIMQTPKGQIIPWFSTKERFILDEGNRQQIKEQNRQSEKSYTENDKSHPRFLIAKKIQGKYTKLSSVRPKSAQEILAQTKEKKEVGGRKYKINPKLFISDAIIEAANNYKEGQVKKNFVIKSSSEKKMNYLNKQKFKSQVPQLNEFDEDSMDYSEKVNHPKISAEQQRKNQIQSQNQKKVSFEYQDNKQINQNSQNQKNKGTSKQQFEPKKDKQQINQEEIRKKNQGNWDFVNESNQANLEHYENENQKSQSGRNSNSGQANKNIGAKNNHSSSQKEKKTQSTNIATEMHEDYYTVSPFFNSSIQGKNEFFSIVKGRLCCVFDEINYLLIFALQDNQLRQGVDTDGQSMLYISLAKLRDIFDSETNYEERGQNQHTQSNKSRQLDQEQNNIKTDFLKQNLEMIYKRFKAIILIDLNKNSLTLDSLFAGITVQLKTPMHPKGTTTKINYSHPQQNIQAIISQIQPTQYNSQYQINNKNLLIVEYPNEELMLQKENRKLEQLSDQFIVLQKFQYRTISNRQGIIAIILNCKSQQIQLTFKLLNSQLEINHYVVVEYLINDYGSYFDSQDTKNAISVLCQSILPILKFDGKNLTYDNKDKWSLTKLVEVPKKGIKKIKYQFVKQHSNDLSLIQKKQEMWIEVYDDSDMELGKIDESHENENESEQEEKIVNKQSHTKKEKHQNEEDSKNNRSKNNSSSTNRPQSSIKIDIKNNLQKPEINSNQNNKQEEKTEFEQKEEYQEQTQFEEKEEINQNEKPKNSENTNQNQQQEENHKKFSLNMSQEKEEDVEYIDVNDPQQIDD